MPPNFTYAARDWSSLIDYHMIIQLTLIDGDIPQLHGVVLSCSSQQQLVLSCATWIELHPVHSQVVSQQFPLVLLREDIIQDHLTTGSSCGQQPTNRSKAAASDTKWDKFLCEYRATPANHT